MLHNNKKDITCYVFFFKKAFQGLVFEIEIHQYFEMMERNPERRGNDGLAFPLHSEKKL